MLATIVKQNNYFMKIFKLIIYVLMISFIGFTLYIMYSSDIPAYKYFEKIANNPLYSNQIDLSKTDTIVWKITDNDWVCKRDLDGTIASLILVNSDDTKLDIDNSNKLDVKIEAYSFLKMQNNRKVDRLVLNERFDSDRPLIEKTNNFGFASVQIFSNEELFIKLIILKPVNLRPKYVGRLKIQGNEMILYSGYGLWLVKYSKMLLIFISYLFLLFIVIKKIKITFSK